MTLRGTVINGVIVPDPGRSLPEGSRVAIDFLSKRKTGASGQKQAAGRKQQKKSRSASSKKHPRQSERLQAFIALAGVWKDRPEWEGKSSSEIAAELRRKSMERRRG